MRYEGLPPLLDCRTVILIVGTFPSSASLTKQEYYANPQNQFWKLIGAVVNENMKGLPYSEQALKLISHHIGLWDVYASCEREGSLDKAIRNPVLNDFGRLKNLSPNLKALCFNGEKASSVPIEGLELKKYLLPSSSSANTITFERKSSEWQQVLSSLLC